MKRPLVRVFVLSWGMGAALSAVEWIFLHLILTTENVYWFFEHSTLVFGAVPMVLSAVALGIAGWKGMRDLTRPQAAVSAALMAAYYLVIALIQQLFSHKSWYSFSLMSLLFMPCRPYSDLWTLLWTVGGLGILAGCLAIATPFVLLLFAGRKRPAGEREETES